MENFSIHISKPLKELVLTQLTMKEIFQNPNIKKENCSNSNYLKYTNYSIIISYTITNFIFLPLI